MDRLFALIIFALALAISTPLASAAERFEIPKSGTHPRIELKFGEFTIGQTVFSDTEVASKMAKLANPSSVEYAEQLAKGVIPVARMPSGEIVAIDRTHTGMAFFRKGFQGLPGEVVLDFQDAKKFPGSSGKGISEKEARHFLEENKLVWMTGADGKRVKFKDLPRSYGDLKQYPWRALADHLQESGLLAKTKIPQAENEAAKFLQEAMNDRKITVKGRPWALAPEALAEAEKIITSQAAAEVPGFKGAEALKELETRRSGITNTLGQSGKGVRLNAKVGGPLTAGLLVASAATDLKNETIDKMIAKAQCPEYFVNTTPTLLTLAQYDLDHVERFLADCRRKKVQVDFSGQIKKLVANDHFGVSQARCHSDGTIKVIHKNGTDSFVHFPEMGRADLIKTKRSGDSSLHYSSEYRPSLEKKGQWEIKTRYLTGASKLATREESLSTLSSRYVCSVDSCEKTEVNLGNTEDVTVNKPFGDFPAEHAKPVAGALLNLRAVVIAGMASTDAYGKTCRLLGAEPSLEVTFVGDSESNSQAAPAKSHAALN